MNQSKQSKQKRVPFFKSIRGKVTVSMDLFIFIPVVVLILLILPNMRDTMKEQTKNYLYDITVATGEKLDLAAAVSVDINNMLQPEALQYMVGSVGITGMDSSYAYVVAADGTMLYHPTESKIGQPVENVVVTGVVNEIKAGKKNIEPQIIEYDFKGVKKYAAYYVNANSDYILVISADEDEVLESVTRITTISAEVGFGIVVLFGVAGYFIVLSLTSPLVKVNEIVNKLADMDFTENEIQRKLNSRKDETGEMSRAVGVLRTKLIEVVSGLKEQSDSILEASDSLKVNAEETATTVEQVEKAVSDISAGATSQADETQKATENVILIGNMVIDTSNEVENLIVNATQMKESGDKATSTLMQLEKINKHAQEAIDIIYEQTNTTNESAMKIREATSLITSIAEETNLLSLNASIEAARAGEQGRGFAVVASQIQKLAEQSNESAQQIENITDSLIADSEKAVKTMGEVKEVMNEQIEHVTKTDAIFAEVKSGINSSIDGVNRIAEKTKKMDEARINVVDVVQNLTAIAQENAASTEETSASVTEVSSIVYNISENASRMKNVADGLEQNMNVFKL
ncbi:MAG: methyl-accepting chemotaxis protein [Butyrivibrio sp.]|nr:methyl-accepting chemotaxis protein [Butyrivibrio sp.]